MVEGLVDVTPGRRVFARVAVAKYPKLGGLNTILSQLQRPEERN